MATYRSFEELDIWKKARMLADRIYSLTCEGSFAKDYSLKDQINRSSGSIMDNIAEGFERGGNKEFVMFLSYAKGSAGEVRSQLYRALDRHHITEQIFKELKEETIAIGKMIGSLMVYLQESPFRGSKFHKPEVSYNLSEQKNVRQNEFRNSHFELQVPDSELS
jgi:four helix bundle protein